MESSWLGPWWDALGNDEQSHVVTARDAQGALVGVLPLYRNENSRTLSMIGDGNTCSDHVTVLAKTGHETDIAKAIGRHLAATASDSDWGWGSRRYRRGGRRRQNHGSLRQRAPRSRIRVACWIADEHLVEASRRELGKASSSPREDAAPPNAKMEARNPRRSKDSKRRSPKHPKKSSGCSTK